MEAGTGDLCCGTKDTATRRYYQNDTDICCGGSANDAKVGESDNGMNACCNTNEPYDTTKNYCCGIKEAT